jgi:hypothetical protein
VIGEKYIYCTEKERYAKNDEATVWPHIIILTKYGREQLGLDGI